MAFKKSFLFLILIFSGFYAQAIKSNCVSLLEGISAENSVRDKDLFAIYDSEVKEIKSNLSKALTPKQRDFELSKALQRRNQEDLALFFKNRVSIETLKKSERITMQKAKSIFNSIFTHPVVGEKSASKYDLKSQEIGFCFGRAAYVHFELIKSGVSSINIVKIFAMGGLYRDNVGWDYHVATAVQDELGTWLVIDSLNNEVADLQSWMKKVSQWDGNRVNPKLRFYFSDPNKFQATSGFYSAEKFNIALYKGYFKDLLKWYSKSENCIQSHSK